MEAVAVTGPAAAVFTPPSSVGYLFVVRQSVIQSSETGAILQPSPPAADVEIQMVTDPRITLRDAVIETW